jgi:integrase
MPYGVSILDAVRDYVARVELVSTSETVNKAVAECLAAKKADGLRPRTLADLRARLKRFQDAFGERTLADISAGELDAWLRSLAVGPVTRNSFRLRLSVLFAFAKARGWVRVNPVLEVPRLRNGNAALPGILTPDQVARLLESASPETLPYWAIGAFAGLRSAELERLKWSDVHFDDKVIEVPALSSKTASRRFVTMRPNLLAWLRPYREAVGPVCPKEALRYRLADDRAAAGLAEWPHNALRHTFASMHLAKFRNPQELALAMGHTRSDITFRYYFQRVKAAEANRFWSITPKVAALPIAAISAALN